MIRSLTFVAAFTGLALIGSASAEAQYVTYYSPVVAPAPTVVYRPVTPVVSYSPVAYTVARPVAHAAYYAPTPVVTTRWRPILGGTVTRVRYRYAPVAYYGY